ncbi:hypothetical protein NGM10_01030 [Halorussus salilacus]|uniref:hypothetical protein n=1 Tax=Halorussus salilacus TaxID=2953750 RepID=UPI00209C860B|nr:hypothetical protein [Halorussus salilacus]USZ68338.1 hypothetical protein NGM10_01030 [Halorussus salilacus]
MSSTRQPESADSRTPEGESETTETARIGASWLLLGGRRWVVAGVVLAGTSVLLVGVLSAYGRAAVRPGSPMNFLLSSLLTGNLTLVTVVLSINQLVLARELAEPGTLRERIERTREYQHSVEETADAGVSPKTPAAFLRFLHESLESETETLADAAADAGSATDAGDAVDGETRERLRQLTESLAADARGVEEVLDGEGESVYAVISATLATNHVDQLQEIAEIRGAAESLPADLRESLGTVESHLLEIDVARKYFRTVYVQKELAFLSRLLLYVGVPAVVLVGLALLFYNAAGAAGVAVPTTALFGVASTAFVVGFAPLAILFAFVLRLAWVAQRTTTVTPFASEASYPSR